jgi:hypothetical protein
MTGASRDPGTSANFRYTTSTDMTSWPDLPGPGQPTELPVRAPPTLTAALGVPAGSLRWIALQHDPAGEGCVWCDDAETFCACDACRALANVP